MGTKIITVKIPEKMTLDVYDAINSVTGGKAYISDIDIKEAELKWRPVDQLEIEKKKGRVMAKLQSRDIIKKAKTELMDEFIMKVNMYGVNKFRREGIDNPVTIHQIKHHDHTIRLETIEKYIDLINELIERDKKGIAV